MARDYKKEYREYHGKPEQRANRSKRVLARRKLEKEGVVKKGDGKDVDHKKRLAKGGTNARSNLKVSSTKENRGWRKGKSGY
jgi:hypothetical protein